MVMAEKSFPEMVWEDVKKVFGHEDISPVEEGKPGSELPAFGKCGCHPGGIHPEVEVVEVEQREPVELIAIPVEVKGVTNVRMLPAKRGSMETFYPGATAGTALLIQGADPRLRRVVLSVTAQACWLGTQEAVKALSVGNTSGGAGLFSAPVGSVTFEGIHEDLWGMAASAGSIVSVRREYWTDV